MSRRFVCFFSFFPSIFRQWNREEEEEEGRRYRRSCIPRLIGSIESRQKFLACPQKSNIPALGSSCASFAPLHICSPVRPREHMHIFGVEVLVSSPFVLFFLLSLTFSSPPSLRVNRRRRYVVFVRCFRLIDVLPPE